MPAFIGGGDSAIWVWCRSSREVRERADGCSLSLRVLTSDETQTCSPSPNKS